MTIEQWLGADNTMGIDIWEKKYRKDEESFDEWVERISGGYEDLKNLILEKKFLFGGRILSNRGVDQNVMRSSLSNCYVITPPEDNIESIFGETCSKLARTYSLGGGCGIDISKLAPRGARVRNTARESSGAASFMELYSRVTESIGQAGRRGALMISISCDHPDVEEFVEVKSTPGAVTKANISVRITDAFMEAVKNGTEHVTTFHRPETGETITKPIDARSLFTKIAQMNWDNAEPGVLFWDRIEKWNLLSNTNGFKYAGVNPCFTGDMKLLTDDGYKPFAELDGRDVNVVSYDGVVSHGKVWCTGERETVNVKMANGDVISCTPDHMFMLIDGSPCAAKDLSGRRIYTYRANNGKHYDERYVKYGFIQGDGQTKHLDTQSQVVVNIGKDDDDIMKMFELDSYKRDSYRSIRVSGYRDDLKLLGFSEKTLPNRVFPTTYKEWSSTQKLSFLRGCFSANGSVVRKHRVQYKCTCKEFILQLQEALNEFNITTNITTNHSKPCTFSNGIYVCKESYDLCINRIGSIAEFCRLIGFVQTYKMGALIRLVNTRSGLVRSVDSGTIQKVYDFSEPRHHWGVVNGYVVHNCAEEPLPAGGSCLLGSLNLSEFVKNQFTDDAEFDMESFYKAVHIATFALNMVLEEGLPLHPLEEQRKSVADWRQIGLGIMGLADMFVKMGCRYGSKESIELSAQIASALINCTANASSELAKEYGAYPMYDKDAVTSTEFFQENIIGVVADNVREYGLRNSQLLTTAPTGTISTMLGISGGMEPMFAKSYTRKTESLHKRDVYYEVNTKIVDDFIAAGAGDIDSEILVTSADLNYRDRINMQSAWQHRIDASISSTVNLPNSATVEDVIDLYTYAHERGLKGITVFRAGCSRAGILVASDSSSGDASAEPEDTTTHTLGRGDILEASDDLTGKKRKLVVGCGNVHLQAWFDPVNGDLTETFIYKGSTGGCKSNEEAVSRLISLSSRAGVDIDTIKDQLMSCGGCDAYRARTVSRHDTSKGSSCPTAMAFALENMHKEVLDEIGLLDECDEPDVTERFELVESPRVIEPSGTHVECPECHESMIFEGGCSICKSCGYSKCD